MRQRRAEDAERQDCEAEQQGTVEIQRAEDLADILAHQLIQRPGEVRHPRQIPRTRPKASARRRAGKRQPKSAATIASSPTEMVPTRAPDRRGGESPGERIDPRAGQAENPTFAPS